MKRKQPPVADPDYSYAEAHVHELTLNQRRVLDLVVVGLTNAEIGARLGMTLDGAKWNISEVLSKLGFSSREGAAEYWRWRRKPKQRIGRAIRSLGALPGLKWVAGGTAVVAAGVVVGLALLGGGESDPDEPNGWFYLEADITVTSRAHTIGTNIDAGDASELEAEVTTSQLKWWMLDQRRGRYEVAGYIAVADGEYLLILDAQGNTSEYTPLPDHDFVFVPAMSVHVGPAHAESLEAFIAEHRTGGADDLTVAGSGTMLGRDVTIVEARPASRSMTETTTEEGTVRTEETSDGVVRYWIDEERMFILRFEIESDVQDMVAEVTHLEYPAVILESVMLFPTPGPE
jgi:DNA-binding CsgD family transcriptional regulator